MSHAFCGCLSDQAANSWVDKCRHSIGSGQDFDFFSYMRESLEEDCSHVVGLSLPIWTIIIFSLLLSWVVGKCPGKLR